MTSCNGSIVHLPRLLDFLHCCSLQMGLKGGYIELVGFNDQLRSPVKIYLSARSCPSTIGQVQIMYHMKRNGAEVPNERAASNPSPQFSVEYLEGPQLPFRYSESILVLLRWFLNISQVLDKPGCLCFSFRYIGFVSLFLLLFCFVLWWSGY